MKKKIVYIALAAVCSVSNAQVRHVRLTHYNPVPEQCDGDPLVTADGSLIDLVKLKDKKLKWCAVSRDIWNLFPKKTKKRIHIEGHGVYEVKDMTSARLKNTVDILLHPEDERSIYQQNVKITILKY